jgi:hypothetical protein
MKLLRDSRNRPQIDALNFTVLKRKKNEAVGLYKFGVSGGITPFKKFTSRESTV